MSYPFDVQKKTWSSCEVFDTNFTDEYYASKTPANQTKHCDRWIYNTTDRQNSAVTEVHNILYTYIYIIYI